MAPDDARPARDRDRPRDVLAVVDTEPVDDAPREPGTARRPGRRWLPLAVLAVPVVAVAAVLAVQAAGGSAFDADAAGERVSAVANGIMDAEEGFVYGSSSVGGPETGVGGFISGLPSRAYDVTVVCASERGRGAHLTVASGGETVGEVDVACSDGADPDAEPLVTVLPLDEAGGGLSFDVAPETPAAVAVVLS